ncbi:MAG: hypothetical protein K0R57_2266 [Paenibacillaceae bacterium]|jgi:carboxyl-terminal processing protease|nr:hypothetical protein [Paenibacillaceae bacterium]
MNKTKKRTRLPIWKKAVITVLLTASVVPAWTASASEATDKVQLVLEILAENHVGGASEDVLSQSAIKAMVESLNDPYTEYMDKSQWGQFVNGITRSYVGVGIQISKAEDGIYIERVFAGTPAEGAGLKQDDKIVKVNDTAITEQTADELVALILGEEGTPVSITVQRGSEQLAKSMSRKAVSLPVLESAYLKGGVGYLKVHSFSEDADEQFIAKLAEMKAKSDFRSLVVDLRDNPGGLLDTAGNIAGQFIKDNVLIHTKTNKGADNPVSIVGGTALDVPVYVLVNGNSASASEVLAGALQDYEAAVIIGTQTYGKGSVQNVYSLTDGSMLKVTIEEYFTPKGHPVNKVGITPDLTVEGSLNQLLTGLRAAGATDLEVAKNRSIVSVNGLQVNDVLPLLEEDGRLWIHSRVLAALIGAEVEWLDAEEAVQIGVKDAAAKAVFSPSAGNARLEQELLFIDVSAFAEKFPQLTVEGNETKLKLHAVPEK